MSEKNRTNSQAMERYQRHQAIELKGGAFLPQNFAELVEFGKIMASSTMVPKNYQGQPGDIIAAVQMGAEVGLPPMAALQNIAVINGRPAIYGDGLLAVAKAAPEVEDVEEYSDPATGEAVCVVRLRGRRPVERRFGEADAKRAGLWGKAGPWTQYPGRMLQMRARGFALRDAVPHRLRGIQIAEELRDTPAEPEWVDEAPATPDRMPAGVHRSKPVEVRGELPEAQPKPRPAKRRTKEDDELARLEAESRAELERAEAVLLERMRGEP